MNIDGARIYTGGIEIGRDCEEKIRQIVNAIKPLSPSSDVSMRFLKGGHTYEVLLWGTANKIPIGVYNRGPSISKVLEAIYRKVKKECVRVWKLTETRRKPRGNGNSRGSLAMVG